MQGVASTAIDTSQLPALWEGFARRDPQSRDHLLALYYNEFRQIARRVLADGGSKLQIQPTELVHEAAIRLLRSENVLPTDQTAFLALGARVMRTTLIDEVRRRKASKREGRCITLWDDIAADHPPRTFDLDDFDEALKRLEDFEPEGARIVELRFYVGLTLEEIAESMSLSLSTIERRWRSARAWLTKELESLD